MADYKFFHIGKANAEILRLEAELTKAQEEAKVASENAEAIAGPAEANVAKLTQAEADLVTAKASVSSLTARAEKAEADLKEANAKLANPSQQLKEAASREALKITQSQGQPPVAATPGAPAASGDILAQHKAIKDSTARTVFYRANKAAIDAAFKALPQKED